MLHCFISLISCNHDIACDVHCGLGQLSPFSGVYSDDFRTPRKQLVWAPGQGFTATTSSWRDPSTPRAPLRSRGLRGPRIYYTPLSPLPTSGDDKMKKTK